MAAQIEDGLVVSSSGRFFALGIGGTLESSLATDWLVSVWDQNAALHACGPSVAMVEETAGAWIKQLLDLPPSASFAFTTGCQLAHFTGLAAARHALMQGQGGMWKWMACSVHPLINILTSSQHHGSLERALRFLGIGTKAINALPANSKGQLDSAVLGEALETNPGPTMVVLNAADLNIGACDPFSSLIPIAKNAGAWVHIDGAFGLFARASRSKQHLLEGVELADSWATDGHKWLNLPFDCGMIIVRDVAAHRAAMTLSASYLTAIDGFRDQIDWNPEWSRRARGVPVYAALMELGRERVEALVDNCCKHCLSLVEGIGRLPGAEILAMPTLNQGLLRFTRPGNSERENYAFCEEVVARINATGEAFFSTTTWQGQRAMRVSVVNWRTDQVAVDRTVKVVAEVLSQAN